MKLDGPVRCMEDMVSRIGAIPSNIMLPCGEFHKLRGAPTTEEHQYSRVHVLVDDEGAAAYHFEEDCGVECLGPPDYFAHRVAK